METRRPDDRYNYDLADGEGERGTWKDGVMADNWKGFGRFVGEKKNYYI